MSEKSSLDIQGRNCVDILINDDSIQSRCQRVHGTRNDVSPQARHPILSAHERLWCRQHVLYFCVPMEAVVGVRIGSPATGTIMGTMGTTGDLNGVEMCPGLALRPLNGEIRIRFRIRLNFQRPISACV